MTTSRSWIATFFQGMLKDDDFRNPEQFKYDEDKMHMLCGQIEKCPTSGKLHWQLFIKYRSPTRLSAVKKFFGLDSIHLEPKKFGKDEDMAKYCSKSETSIPGTYFEHGSIVSQGCRTDLKKTAEEISNGRKVDDIAIEDPTLYHQYGRTLNKLEDLALRKRVRTEMTKGIWYYGPTGTGKSHKAFEGFTPTTHYVHNVNDKGWWDGYTQQDTVIINDFRGEMKFAELLNLVDKWPHSVSRRNREPMPFISKTVIITSSIHPREVYLNACSADDRFDQLLRRFEIVELKAKF